MSLALSFLDRVVLIYEAKLGVLMFKTFLGLGIMIFFVENWHTKSQGH